MKGNKINKHKTDRNSALIIVSIFAKEGLYFLHPGVGSLSILVDSCRYWTGETARSRYQSDISQDTILGERTNLPPGNFRKLKRKKRKKNRRRKVRNCSKNLPNLAFYSYLHFIYSYFVTLYHSIFLFCVLIYDAVSSSKKAKLSLCLTN
jgi:hypothetical protein